MTNPYQAPTASVQATPAAGTVRSGKILFGLGLSCAVIAALLLTLVAPNFAQTFEAFGADLPLATSLVLKFYLASWLLPVGALAGWLFWPRPHHRGLVSCLIGVLGLVLLIPLAFFALYLPIFELAATA